jgi:hypothetical protein
VIEGNEVSIALYEQGVKKENYPNVITEEENISV